MVGQIGKPENVVHKVRRYTDSFVASELACLCHAAGRSSTLGRRMPTNIEIKAMVADLPALRKRVGGMSDTPGKEIYQQDMFFAVPQGRLKLRILSPESGELIYYERPDGRDPKPSHYLISRTYEPDTLRAVLTTSLGLIGTVRKKRTLYLVGNTRVHLDEVDGLGTYMELEVVLAANESTSQGERTARELMEALGIERSALVRGAYVDLINAAKGKGNL